MLNDFLTYPDRSYYGLRVHNITTSRYHDLSDHWSNDNRIPDHI